MSLIQLQDIPLPDHTRPGGFDHAAIHYPSARLYVAHTINNALDVIDCHTDRYHHSIPDLIGVAGVLVSEEGNLVFTSNRGENTVGIFRPDDEANLFKVPVGVRPNGLAFDVGHGLLLAANVGDPDIPSSYTLSIVNLEKRKQVRSIPVPGRTRWAVFDDRSNLFYVNIADPAQIVVLSSQDTPHIARIIAIPSLGPHGLDLDVDQNRLYCACDARALVTVDLDSGEPSSVLDLSGVPDVVFYNADLKHLYIAIGDPGLIDVFDTQAMAKVDAVPTEKGAHTLAFDAGRNKVYAFLPQSHRVLVFADR